MRLLMLPMLVGTALSLVLMGQFVLAAVMRARPPAVVVEG